MNTEYYIKIIKIIKKESLTSKFHVYVMVLAVYPPDYGSVTLNSPEHSSATTPSLGKLSSSLPVLDAFTFTRNC